MARVWYCSNCGYEVKSRGRCHSCRQKLVPSAMPELETGPDDEEVGYRIDGWTDRDRGQLILRLNDLGIEHRFEDEELIIESSDEARVDDLVATLADNAEAGMSGELEAGDEEDVDDATGDGYLDDVDGSGRLSFEDEPDGADDDFAATLRLLADAATRLRMDPTDMQADADVAEASAGVFMVDSYGPFDDDDWSAVGRVTRRLLSALGAEEALEEDIRKEAGILEKLLARLGSTPTAVAASDGSATRPGERTVYELADWQPDQRAELSILLDQKGVAHEWDGDELLVPSVREDEVEALFDQVGGADDVDDDGDSDERRYQAVAELFAACGRLAGDPTDEARRDNTLRWIEVSEGPPLFGMDEVEWFRIRSRARLLATAVEEGHDPNEIFEHANHLHDLLRSVV